MLPRIVRTCLWATVVLCFAVAAQGIPAHFKEDPSSAPPGPLAGGGQFDALGVSLLSNLRPRDLDPRSSQANDCWGYVSPSGREYAIVGLDSSTAFVEITDPADPDIIAVIPDNRSIWSDIKVYRHWAYNVNENGSGGGNGIQVLDMGDIDNGIVTLVQEHHGQGIRTAHNIVVDTDSGFLYAVGANIFNGGLVAYDLSDPASPSFAGAWNGRNVHDAQVVTFKSGPNEGRQIAFCCVGGFGFEIVDVTDKSNMTSLGRTTYPAVAFAHQGWLSEDRRYFYMGDEADEGAFNFDTRTLVFDVTDLNNPTFVRSFSSGLPSIDHNLYVRGNLIYEANYTTGLRIFDATDPLFPVQVAYFDTYPENNGRGFAGAWSNYPFFPSGVVIVSDEQRGLFVLSVCSVVNCKNPPLAKLTNITFDVDTGCGEFLWTLNNVNEPFGPEMDTFYLDVEVGDGAQRCALMTPPQGWTVELCAGYDADGHALYRFSGGTPILIGAKVIGRLTIDTNGNQPRANPQTGITVPPRSVVLHTAQGQDIAACDFSFGPTANGEWSPPVTGAAFLPVPSMALWAKTLLALAIATGGVYLVRRNATIGD
ncbi:MAG: choice-of-anchor B family protein [Phycisphaerae bacterium]